jgi:hypothetical protein
MSSKRQQPRLVKTTLLILVILSAREYANSIVDMVWASGIAAGLQEKPFVYRALVPWLAQFLVLLGFRADVALSLIVILSAVGLLYGLQYLLSSFRRS